MISISINRSSLSLPPLVIGDVPHGVRWHLPEDGVVWPAFGTRRKYAPDSDYAAGRTLLAAVQDATEMPLVVYAHGGSAVDLAASKAELEQALAQWSYDLTLTVDSAAYTYHAEVLYGIPWGPIDTGMVRARMAKTSFSIPLNP